MDVDADVDRVHGGLGMGAVASAALHPDDQVVTGGGDHAGAVAAQARWNHGDHVGTHGRIHMGDLPGCRPQSWIWPLTGPPRRAGT